MTLNQMNHAPQAAQEETVQTMPAEEAVTAQEISGELVEDASAQETQDAIALEAAIREGVAELFEDGWTPDELLALSQDEGVRADVAAGKDVVRAACAYLRRMQQGRHAAMGHRRALPISRSAGAGAPQENSIEAMTDEQFDAFSRRAREAAMMGKKVKM